MLADPTTTAPKDTVAGLGVSTEPNPLPLSDICDPAGYSLLVTTNAPARRPGALGVKITDAVQVVPLGMGVGQSLVWAKSPVVVTEMLCSVTRAVRLTVWAGLEVPTS